MAVKSKLKPKKKAASKPKSPKPKSKAKKLAKRSRKTIEVVEDPPTTEPDKTIGVDLSKDKSDSTSGAPASVDHSSDAVLHEIEKLGSEAEEAKTAWLSLKDQASAAKKDFESRMERMLRAAVASKNDADRPLFNQEKPKTAEVSGDPSAAWRNVACSEWFDGVVLKALDEKSMGTMGQFSDWLSFGNKITDLAGVGPGKAELVKDRFDEFWAKYPQENSAPDPQLQSSDAKSSRTLDDEIKDEAAGADDDAIDAGWSDTDSAEEDDDQDDDDE